MEQKVKKITPAQVVIFAISFALAYFAANFFFSSEKEPSEMLINVSNEMNRTLPKMLDDVTRLDSTTVNEMTLTYHYTLTKLLEKNPEIDLEAVKLEMKAKAQDNLDTNPVMNDYRVNNISLHYTFNDAENNKVFEYTVQPKKQKE